VDALNPTQGSLLGLLHDSPKTGWDLLQEVRAGLARFWNVTPSHVYRELNTLEQRKLVRAGKPGAREKRPFAITAAGRRAFTAWISDPPGPEQIRYPLLVRLWFGRLIDDESLASFIDAERAEHAQRLALYEDMHADDPHVDAVVRFGVHYERAVLAWLDEITI
jgi:DNA-binding PadR family transcriptional regulator